MPSDVESPRWATALQEVRSAVAEPDDGSLFPARAAAGWAPAAGEDPWPDGAGRLEPASDAAVRGAGAEEAPGRPAGGGGGSVAGGRGRARASQRRGVRGRRCRERTGQAG